MKRCCLRMWSRSELSAFRRQATKSWTDRCSAAKSPERTTHFKSAVEITLLATTPPKLPESSRNVHGQIVNPSAFITVKAWSIGSSWFTETCKMVLRRSKTLALNDLSTAVGAVDFRAKFKKSRQEKTPTISLPSLNGTRRTCPWRFLRCRPAIKCSTSRRGVSTSSATKLQKLEQFARSPTCALQICCKHSAAFDQQEPASLTKR
mmetsp:Transcript_71093/g.156876  ORF Transcript_71093/g.156876 Transcript_71093/m.156876 type:complete len:206 (+) Transcript_71093:180-797(+)